MKWRKRRLLSLFCAISSTRACSQCDEPTAKLEQIPSDQLIPGVKVPNLPPVSNVMMFPGLGPWQAAHFTAGGSSDAEGESIVCGWLPHCPVISIPPLPKRTECIFCFEILLFNGPPHFCNWRLKKKTGLEKKKNEKPRPDLCFKFRLSSNHWWTACSTAVLYLIHCHQSVLPSVSSCTWVAPGME